MNGARYWSALFCSVLCLCSIGSLVNGRADQPKSQSRDWQDLVVLTKNRPLLLRLHIQIEGKSFLESWDRYLDAVFDFLDVNGDTQLDGKEWACAPSAEQILQQLRGEEIEPGPAPEFAKVSENSAKEVISRDQFKHHYWQSGAGPILLEYGERFPKNDAWSEKLFELLDKNKDEKLSEKELRSAATALRFLDRDDDEMITIQELLGYDNFYSRFQFRLIPNGRPGSRALLLRTASTQIDSAVVSYVLQHYDRNKDGKLNKDEIGLPQQTFARIDKDRDKQWTQTNLAEWLSGDADLQMTIELDNKKNSLKTKSVADPAVRAALLKLNTFNRTTGLLIFSDGREQAELLSGPPGKIVAARLAKQHLERFKLRDDGDGFLDTKEIYQPPFEWTAVLRLADRNADDRLALYEMQAYVKLIQKAAVSFTRLTVADRPPSLFEFIDADHDGRLGLRDLSSAWQRLAPSDQNEDEAISKNEIPSQIHLVVSYGPPPGENQQYPAPGYGPAQMQPGKWYGPRWFLKMDANEDGDVSPREFLGPANVFRRIDTDGDGLIDAQEAEKANVKSKPGSG